MKRFILILAMCFCAFIAEAKDVGLTGSTVTTSGSVTRGCRGVTFIFSSDFTGSVAGVTFSGATDSSFSPPIQTGDTTAAIAYVVTTGSIRIMTLR